MADHGMHMITDISRCRLIEVMGTAKCGSKKSIIIIMPRTTKARKTGEYPLGSES